MRLPTDSQRRNKLKGLFSILGAIVYGVSPIDLLPDIIPLIGWVDDISISGLLVLMGGSYLLRAMFSRPQTVTAPYAPPQIPTRPQ